MTITRAQRQEFLKNLPYVKYLATGQPCDGLRWSRMPLKAIYNWGPKRQNPPVGVDKYKCKTVAHWKFTALKRSRAHDGIYCMSHLYTQLNHDDLEEQRTIRWFNKLKKELGF